MTSVQVKNNNTKDAHFQITILKKVKKNGREVLEESKDIVITPVIFDLPPNKSQLIRLALKGPVDVNSQNEYTVSIKELPARGPKRAGSVNTVQLITNFMVPLSAGKSQ
jgi:fimbrial chaperone protein